MTLSQYRSNRCWLGAIELGPKLMNLAEELPASEETGLSLQLRQLMVKLPTSIGADLVLGNNTRKTVCFRLQATLELIEHIYPALDTAKVRADADDLVELMMSDKQFAADTDSSPVAAPSVPAAETPEAPKAEPAETPVLPAEVAEAIKVPVPAADAGVEALAATHVVVPTPDSTTVPIAPTDVPVTTEPTT